MLLPKHSLIIEWKLLYVPLLFSQCNRFTFHCVQPFKCLHSVTHTITSGTFIVDVSPTSISIIRLNIFGQLFAISFLSVFHFYINVSSVFSRRGLLANIVPIWGTFTDFWVNNWGFFWGYPSDGEIPFYFPIFFW